MIDVLKNYLVVLIVAVSQIVLFVLGNYGVLSGDQVQAIMATLATFSTWAALRMPAPLTRPPSRPPGPPAVAIVLGLALSTLGGCSSSLTNAKAEAMQARLAGNAGAATATPERCAGIDSARAWAGAGGKGFAALGGASGLSAVVVTDDPELAKALAISSASAAAIGVALIALSEDRAAAFVRECAAP